jgi:diguanylate cyclase (GGDEF)-like protein/PAS domain S-box-containing protein
MPLGRGADRAPARIQIVEDERIVAMDLRETVESFGYDVTSLSARAEDAISMARAERPDLILMDINLEGEMKGTEAALRIRQESDIPVIFLTAYAGDAELQLAQASAPYGYLLKPFQARELHATLTMALARRAAEIATEKSEERLRLALDSGSMVAWEWPASDAAAWIYSRERGIFAYAPQVLALGPDALIQATHPDDREEISGQLQWGARIDAEIRLRQGPQDGYRWVQIHAQSFPEPESGRTRVIGVAQDVTDRRTMQERLRHTEAALASTGDGIMILNAERRVLSINNAFTQLTGFTQDEVFGKDPDDFLHARRLQDHFYPLANDMRGGFGRGESACRRKSGEIFPAIQTVSAVVNQAGAVTNYVSSFTDISELRRREQKITHLVLHDVLTGLGNRRLLEQRLDTDLHEARRNGHALGFFFLDIDGFGSINDSLGHDGGDAMLKMIAARILSNIRRGDLAIRIGGDEFLIIMQAADASDCARLAEKLLAAVAEPLVLDDQRISISCSIGIAMFPRDGEAGSALIGAADSAMYEAKRSGRGRYAMYTADMAERSRRRLLIEQGLRRAITQGELYLQYQPIVRLDDYRIVAFEALARWQHAQAGAILPAQFIPIAEESGLIDDIGDYVLQRACTEWRPHLQDAAKDMRLAVNVSVRQFYGPDLVGRVQRILDETGFCADRLEIEVTESALQEHDSGRTILERLKRLGATISVDDFGTGYSSLSLLNRLPIDVIKIDRSFVGALASDPGAVAIVAAVMAMARSLKLHVVAEGIETPAQLRELQGLGCDRGQGYLFCKSADHGSAVDLARKAALWPLR